VDVPGVLEMNKSSRARRLKDTVEHAIWLVWGIKTLKKAKYPTPFLYAVATSRAKAEMYSMMIRRDSDEPVTVRIERRETNHLYGHSMLALILGDEGAQYTRG